MIQVPGKNLTELWFNMLVHLATGKTSMFYSPSMYARRIYGSTEGIHFETRNIMDKDFYKYSGYIKSTKVKRLKETYFSAKVEKQYKLLSETIRSLQPRQSRGFLTFSEPAFNKTDRLRCLDSLFIQKATMTTYEALIVFRSTEIWPKTYMDFVFLYDLLEGLVKKRVKCILFAAFMTSTFINFHQAPTAAMFMRKYGINTWNPEFKKSLEIWKEKFGDPKCLDTMKMQWIRRVLVRTYRLFEEDGVNIEMLIKGK